tara:strand:+ start:623 stop:1975 length:1353 start_codon:yes stop_codon:yes gene_type:complete
MSIDFVILAAGKGTRMGGDSPKVLASLAGQPMLQNLINTTNNFKKSKRIVVVGHKANEVKKQIKTTKNTGWVKQNKQLGTGHAVKQALSSLRKGSVAVILYGDVPLVSSGTLNKLISSAKNNSLALLTFNKDNPSGYGRIIRKGRNVIDQIVEEKDASASQKEITEVNSGIMAIKSNLLSKLIPLIKNKNAAKEFYLTDIVELANKNKISVKALLLKDNTEVLGANNLQELHDLERAYQKRLAENLIRSGVRVADSSRLDVRGSIDVGRGSFIDINSVFDGNNTVGRGVSIGPGCYISNSIIKNDAIIHANTVIEDSIVGSYCEIGPFARIRGGTEMQSGSELGNFVEANRSKVGKSSKAKHLTYLGDTTLGTKVNVGAGTITCNYDGKKKHKTIAEDNVFIGSNSSLVAPVRLGRGSYTGAGSVITKNVGTGELAVGRGKQVNLKKKKK